MSMRETGPQGWKPLKWVKITSDLVWVWQSPWGGSVKQKQIHVPNMARLSMAALSMVKEGFDSREFSLNGADGPPPIPAGADPKLLNFLATMRAKDLLDQKSRDMKARCKEWERGRSEKKRAEEVLKSGDGEKAMALLDRMSRLGRVSFVFGVLGESGIEKAFLDGTFKGGEANRARYHAMCRGKRVYGTETEAHAAAETWTERQMYEPGDEPLGMTGYGCPICEQWHIGHDRAALRKSRFEAWAGVMRGAGVKIGNGNPHGEDPCRDGHGKLLKMHQTMLEEVGCLA